MSDLTYDTAMIAELGRISTLAALGFQVYYAFFTAAAMGWYSWVTLACALFHFNGDVLAWTVSKVNEVAGTSISYTSDDTDWMGEFAWLNYAPNIMYFLYIFLAYGGAFQLYYIIPMAVFAALTLEELATPYMTFNNNELLYSIWMQAGYLYSYYIVLIAGVAFYAGVYLLLPYEQVPWFWEQWLG